VLKQIVGAESTKRLPTTTPNRNKSSITQRKKLVFNNRKIGLAKRKFNQENIPLAITTSKTLADPTLAKAVTKTRTYLSSNILTSKSGKFTKNL